MKDLPSLIAGFFLLVSVTACVDRTPYTKAQQDEINRGRAPKIATPVAAATKEPARAAVKKSKKSKKPAYQKEAKIALLAPLSGKHARLGSHLVDAGMLALFDKESSIPAAQRKVRVVLIPKDTKGTAEGAATAAREAAKAGAKMIVGPLYGEAARGAARALRGKNIPMLALTNQQEVAEKNVYVFGFSPEEQASRVSEEAMARGVRKLAVLVPNNDYGQLVASAARRSAIRYGQTLAGIEFYPPKSHDVDIEIQRILGGSDASKAPLDALLIAEQGAKLQQIMTSLNRYGIHKKGVQFLGTGLWDNPNITKVKSLRGGWFASAPMHQQEGFYNRFSGHYGYAPQQVVALTYDAVVFAANLAGHAALKGKPISQRALTRESGYKAPASGLFRCHTDGTCQRALAVMEIGKSGFSELSPAPRTFEED